MKAARLVGVGVPKLDHDELVTLELDRVVCKGLREYEVSR